MLSLKPPFNGKDMDMLYKRVCKGAFPRIPEHYSNDIWQVVQLMLRVEPEKRPSCQELIESNLFKHYSQKLANLDSVDKTFIETIDSTSPGR
jgi:NIMA (never in mitosis gene a)-related kinase